MKLEEEAEPLGSRELSRNNIAVAIDNGMVLGPIAEI
jgi:hypothetical protein